MKCELKNISSVLKIPFFFFNLKHGKCLDNNINFMHANDTDVMNVFNKCAPSLNGFIFRQNNNKCFFNLWALVTQRRRQSDIKTEIRIKNLLSNSNDFNTDIWLELLLTFLLINGSPTNFNLTSIIIKREITATKSVFHAKNKILVE